jgi:hypothetical protein
MRKLCPAEVTFLLHCDGCVGRAANSFAPVIVDAIDWMLQEGLIEGCEEYYRTTKRGRALVIAICNTPLPVAAWVDATGQVLCDF